MNGPADVWFTIPMLGCSFQVPVKSDGRLMPVCQLTIVVKVWSNSTRRRPPGTVVSTMSICCRALLMTSLTEKLLLQFHGPMRSGVSKSRLDSRWSANSVSRAPPGRTTDGWIWGNVCLLLNEKPGDHVMDRVRLIADGVRLTDGMVCDTRPRPTSCCRPPPRRKLPQSNCLVKLNCDTKVAVARNGFTVLV